MIADTKHADKRHKIEEKEEDNLHRTYYLRNTPQREHHSPPSPKKLKKEDKKDGSELLQLLWRTTTTGLISKIEQEVFSVEKKSPLMDCFKVDTYPLLFCSYLKSVYFILYFL